MRVFPLAPRSKVPLLSSREGGAGFLDATVEVPKVSEWWTQVPNANIGLRPPVRPDGCKIVVIDVDVQNAGLVTWRRFLETYGPTPPTLTARTGQGGAHLWFWVDGSCRSTLGPGIDCKTGVNGYVVAPPSRHPSGRTYTWISNNVVAWAPPWLNRQVEKPAKSTRARKLDTSNGSFGNYGLVQTVLNAREGERNNLLFWAACRALETGMSLEYETSPLCGAALAIGLGESEIRSVFQSARKRHDQ
ncbi:bifunctional DNA primase/polymerase [Rhodococcus sp. BP-332]|nr:bifunctional DNA primase/polymerase [Rhodococcus sp. BP-332]